MRMTPSTGLPSNDVFPPAVHLAALDELHTTLLPALRSLARRSRPSAGIFDDGRQADARTLMDPCRDAGHEFGGYAAPVRQGISAAEVTTRGSAQTARRNRRCGDGP